MWALAEPPGTALRQRGSAPYTNITFIFFLPVISAILSAPNTSVMASSSYAGVPSLQDAGPRELKYTPPSSPPAAPEEVDMWKPPSKMYCATTVMV